MFQWDGPKSLPKNLSDWPILDNCDFENFVLPDEPFAKALRNLEFCVFVNNNLFGKLVSSLKLPKTFDERFKFNAVPFVTSDFNLLSCELDNFDKVILY